jgi:hypothetical protein
MAVEPKVLLIRVRHLRQEGCFLLLLSLLFHVGSPIANHSISLFLASVKKTTYSLIQIRAAMNN